MKKYILPLLVFSLLTLVAFTGCERQRPCEPFPEPVWGYIECPNGFNRLPYLQVGWRHFRITAPDFELVDGLASGSTQKALEVNGMTGLVVGHIYGNEGWIFERDFNPFWDYNARRLFPAYPVTEECRIELDLAIEAFTAEHGNFPYINVYAFDGVTVVDAWQLSIWPVR
ncbi:MAG: hypothetical protein FWC70_00960 [Defluviitaleaceae bacterium]|nr:hypothetical protein [Defluviitaleaceae bacterium]